MTSDTDSKTFTVDGVDVSFVRDEHGARWKCSECKGECEHLLKLAAWLTLRSWSSSERTVLH